MYLRFKVLHRVFRYIKLMYNYPHIQKERPFQGHKVFNYIKTYIHDKRQINLRSYYHQILYQFNHTETCRCM